MANGTRQIRMQQAERIIDRVP